MITDRPLTRVDKGGQSYPLDIDTVLYKSERVIIDIYPLIEKIVDTETGEEVWHRTMAYFEGDYDPGVWTPKK